MWKRSGVKPKEMCGSECPDIFIQIWQWFLELNATRGNNGFGASPISFTEIKAWSELTDNALDQGEVMLLKKLDRVALEKVDKDVS